MEILGDDKVYLLSFLIPDNLPPSLPHIFFSYEGEIIRRSQILERKANNPHTLSSIPIKLVLCSCCALSTQSSFPLVSAKGTHVHTLHLVFPRCHLKLCLRFLRPLPDPWFFSTGARSVTKETHLAGQLRLLPSAPPYV